MVLPEIPREEHDCNKKEVIEIIKNDVKEIRGDVKILLRGDPTLNERIASVESFVNKAMGVLIFLGAIVGVLGNWVIKHL